MHLPLCRDKQSGMLKGDGLITYLKAPSVQLACQILDGTPLRAVGPNMSVSEAKFEMKGQQYQDKKSGAAAGATKQRQKSGGSRGGRGGSKSGRGRGRGRAPGIQEKLERKLGWGGFDDLLPPEKVSQGMHQVTTFMCVLGVGTGGGCCGYWRPEVQQGGTERQEKLERNLTWGGFNDLLLFHKFFEGGVGGRGH
jgi:hypothetical protein